VGEVVEVVEVIQVVNEVRRFQDPAVVYLDTLDNLGSLDGLWPATTPTETLTSAPNGTMFKLSGRSRELGAASRK
jgi:hypothetical protein